MYTIRLVDPRQEQTLWAALASGQEACYARFGASKALATFDPFSGRVFAIAVLKGEGLPVAGARIHVRDRWHPLPIERHFADHQLMREELEHRMLEGVGEVSGLWARDGLAGTGIGASIVAAAAAHGPLLCVRNLIAFVHQHHRFSDAVGFYRDERFGEHAYPDARYRSHVRWCDTYTLDRADRAVRRTVFHQRGAALRGERIPLTFPYPAPSLAAVGA
jgi:hypothetical protein